MSRRGGRLSLKGDCDSYRVTHRESGIRGGGASPPVVQIDEDSVDPLLDDHGDSDWSLQEVCPEGEVKEELLDDSIRLSDPQPPGFYSWQVCEGALVEKVVGPVIVEPVMEVKEEDEEGDDDEVPYMSHFVSEEHWGSFGFQAGDIPVAEPRRGGGRRRSGETTSIVWEFFALPHNGNVRDSEIVICKMCSAIVRRGKATSHLGTSALWAHMRRKHPDVQESYGRQASDSSVSPEPMPGPSNIATNYTNRPKKRRVIQPTWPSQTVEATQAVSSPTLLSPPPQQQPQPPPPPPTHRPYDQAEFVHESRVHRHTEHSVHERAMREAMYSCVATYCGLCWQLLSRGERDEDLRAHLVEMHLRLAHPVRFRNLEREVAMEMYF
ncbi:uncharacterized protein O3C94_021927 [Discoglossus pictus]